ncbi:hypothetical protein D1AOALGA4SA_10254 [Olavius algarvensis Delta 1 endosymbiont]|nr:hypothetical protein D1AOALGA4SA_10254 [Olavius algarvensis Delta 1 endosymbiont]
MKNRSRLHHHLHYPNVQIALKFKPGLLKIVYSYHSAGNVLSLV